MAQSFSVTTVGGYLWLGPMLRHDMDFEGYYGNYTSRERLSLSDAPLFGLRVTRWWQSWGMYAAAEYASSRLRYTYETSTNINPSPDLPPLTTGVIRNDPAKIRMYDVGFARKLRGIGAAMTASLGFTVTHLTLVKRALLCPSGFRCADPWNNAYNVPAVTAGLSAQSPSFHSVSLVVAANAVMGKIDTRSFSENPPPNAFLYEAPASRPFNVMRALVGVQVNH
jgi:hypothetical protein